MNRPAALVVLSAFLLAGCVEEKIARRSVADQALVAATQARVVQGQDCCASYQQMQFRPLAPDSRQEISLDPSSAIHAFAFGKSRFLAFSLPPIGPGDELMVGALDLYSGSSARAIFHPTVIFLSETFQPLAEQPSVALTDHYTGWSTEGHAAHIPLAPKFADARYVIVAADPRYVGRAFDLPGRSGLVPAGPAFVPVSVPAQAFPYGYEGKGFLEITKSR